MLKQHLPTNPMRSYSEEVCMMGVDSEEVVEWRLFQNILLGNIKLDLGNKNHITASCFAPQLPASPRVYYFCLT